MILSEKVITKLLIKLRGSAGWSAPVLFPSPRVQVFSRRGPIVHEKETKKKVTDLEVTFQKFMGATKEFGNNRADKEFANTSEIQPVFNS